MKKFITIAFLGLMASFMTGCVSLDQIKEERAEAEAERKHYKARKSTYGPPTHMIEPSGNPGLDLAVATYNQSNRVLQEDSLIVTFDIVKHPYYYGSYQLPEIGRQECEVLIGEAGAPNMEPVACDKIELKGNTVFVYYTLNGNRTTYALSQARGEYAQNGHCLYRGFYPEQTIRTKVVWTTHDNISQKGLWGWVARKGGCS